MLCSATTIHIVCFWHPLRPWLWLHLLLRRAIEKKSPHWGFLRKCCSTGKTSITLKNKEKKTGKMIITRKPWEVLNSMKEPQSNKLTPGDETVDKKMKRVCKTHKQTDTHKQNKTKQEQKQTTVGELK